MSLSGKRILVTGSASGIGAETARLLREQGAYVLGFDLRQVTDNVDEFHSLNLLDNSSIDAAADAIEGRIHGLCNIAGLPPSAGRSHVLKVNLLGLCKFTARLAGKFAHGSSIVNVASIAGFGWLADMDRVRACLELDPESSLDDLETFCEQHDVNDVSSYPLSKEALIAWTKIQANEWRERGVRLNSVSPGPTDTPILKDFIAAFGEKASSDIARIGRPGQPAEIAPAIAFLCSDEARWINGVNLAVDGGLEAEIYTQGDAFAF